MIPIEIQNKILQYREPQNETKILKKIKYMYDSLKENNNIFITTDDMCIIEFHTNITFLEFYFNMVYYYPKYTKLLF